MFSLPTELFSFANFHIILQGEYLSWKIQKVFHNVGYNIQLNVNFVHVVLKKQTVSTSNENV